MTMGQNGWPISPTQCSLKNHIKSRLLLFFSLFSVHTNYTYDGTILENMWHDIELSNLATRTVEDPQWRSGCRRRSPRFLGPKEALALNIAIQKWPQQLENTQKSIFLIITSLFLLYSKWKQYLLWIDSSILANYNGWMVEHVVWRNVVKSLCLLNTFHNLIICNSHWDRDASWCTKCSTSLTRLWKSATLVFWTLGAGHIFKVGLRAVGFAERLP